MKSDETVGEAIPAITEDFRAMVTVFEERGRDPEDLFFACMFGVAAFHGAADPTTRSRVEAAVRSLLVQLYKAPWSPSPGAAGDIKGERGI